MAAEMAMLIALLGAMHMFASPSLAPYDELMLPAAEPAPAELHARFFGVSTILFSDDETSIMIDGFFSRPSMLELAIQRIKPDGDRIARALDLGDVEKVNALLVAHSHHDHVLDSARVAQIVDATIFGSSSTKRIVEGQDLDGVRLEEVKAGARRIFGHFEIDFFESPHSPGVAPSGPIEGQFRMPARAWEFKAGESYAYRLRHPDGYVLIVPSANFLRGNFSNVCADVVFLGVGGLGKQRNEFVQEYWRETVGATGARTVILIHWDDFTRPLDEPLRAFPYFGDDLERTIERLKALATAEGRNIYLMPPFVPVALRPVVTAPACPRS